jgi:3-oxoacyl-[acyl-carrier-protein] synthase-1
MRAMSGKRCFISAVGLANALGEGCDAVRAGLLAGDTSGMVLEDGWMPDGQARVGRVSAELPPLAPGNERYDSRNNRLMLLALEQIGEAVARALDRVGPQRLGIVLGTSTSGIHEGEAAIAALQRSGGLPAGFDYRQQEIGAAAPFLSRHLKTTGPAYMVSTACTSSAKAIAAATP